MKIKKIILTAAVCMAAVCLSAQPAVDKQLILNILSAHQKAARQSQKQPALHEQPGTGIQLSLWNGVGTQHKHTQRSTCFNLGLQSSMYQLHGLGINALGAQVRRTMKGMQVAGIANMNRLGTYGLSVAGLINLSGVRSQGILLSGLTNITGAQADGCIVSGLMNFSGNRANGLLLSGLANITGEKANGVMASGLLNVLGGDMKGLQLAGIANVTARQLQGAQVGLFNYTTQGKGLQIGLINYYQESFDGLQLGLVNLHPHTRVQLLVYGGNSTAGNVGVRFQNDLFYTILGMGAYRLHLRDRFSSSVSYRAGLSLPLCKRLSLSGDLGFEHVESYRNHSAQPAQEAGNAMPLPKRFYSLQTRLNLECKLTSRCGIFVSGGYSWDRYYTHHTRPLNHRALIEGGLILGKL